MDQPCRNAELETIKDMRNSNKSLTKFNTRKHLLESSLFVQKLYKEMSCLETFIEKILIDSNKSPEWIRCQMLSDIQVYIQVS